MIKYRCTNSKKFISRRTACRLLKNCNFQPHSFLFQIHQRF